MSILFGIFVAALVMAGALMILRWRGQTTVTNAQVSKLSDDHLFTPDIEAKQDQRVAESQRLWQHVHDMPLFWVGVFLTAMSIAANGAAAYGMSASSVGVAFALALTVRFMLFTAADLAVPAIAMVSDNGTGEWYEVKADDRSATAWSIMAICGVIQLFVVWVAVLEVMNTSTAANTKTALSFTADTQRLGKINQQLGSLPAEPETYAGLKSQADQRERAAMIESHRASSRAKSDPTVTTWGPHCGPACRSERATVDDLRKRQAIAQSRESLIAERKALQTKLDGSTNDRTDASPWATGIADASGLNRSMVETYAFVLLGWGLYIVSFLVWLRIADAVGIRKQRAYQRVGQEMDRKRIDFGRAPKYIKAAPATPAAQIEGPKDRIEIHHIAADDLVRRFPNNPYLKAIYELFGTLVVPVQGESVSKEDMHKRYKIKVMRADPNAIPATSAAFMAALETIILVRDDIQFNDGQIHGWAFADALAETAAKEAAE
jgi:hypothetical protein